MSWLMKSAAWLLLNHFCMDASSNPSSLFFYPEYCIVYAAIYIIKLRNVLPHLNERQKRLVLATEVKALGWGGVSRVAQATGVSRGTIYKVLE
jgi:hypothetical protein